jgi:hypothetical protein
VEHVALVLRHPDTVEEVMRLQTVSTSLSIAASRSGRAFLAVPKMSENLVAYMAGQVAVSRYKHHDGPFDSRVKGVAEHAFLEAFKNLNKLKNEHYMAYFKSKLGE